ncbi:MAG TPA: 50S ribosomal protein L32 [Elusimicrobia bacterium]|nr:50S ribosomal protein L32 [Elusimicrobiota bacterium]HBT61749.1 50S ribosomal protein L32 [Elusimicrobiota bacterium]
MPNPKRKHTRSRRDSRRAQNWRLDAVTSSACPNCKTLRRPHMVCPNCGFYNGKLAVAPKQKKEKASQGEGGQQQQPKE